jgi:DNA-binding response OmpR family regulator
VSDADIIRSLKERIETLEEEIRQLREDSANIDSIFTGVLSRQQLALLMAINKRPLATYAYLDHVTENHGKYNRYEGEMHQTLRTKVAVWKLRQKLKPYGIEIKTWRGVGYYLDDANKEKLKQLMEKKDDRSA